MAIITQYHKDTDTTYVYESISYWDAEKKQSRSKRKCIGKIDPQTGEMVPTGKRGPKKNPAPDTSNELARMTALHDQIQKENMVLKARITELEKQLSEQKSDSQKLRLRLQKIHNLSMDSNL